jgi:hypothetical protein
LAALFLVALNGLFVAAEFAFVRIRATQVDRLVEEGKSSAGMVKIAQQKLDQYLAVCQLGITVCSLGIGALAAGDAGPTRLAAAPHSDSHSAVHRLVLARGLRGAGAQDVRHPEGGGDLALRGAVHEVLLLSALPLHHRL